MHVTLSLVSLFFAFSPQSTRAIPYDVYWRDYAHGDIPSDAIEIDSDGNYIGQIHVEKGLIPAMIYPHLHMAVYELFGKKTTYDHIKILCAADKRRIYWELVDFDEPQGNQMKNAIVGGYYANSATDPFNVFIGKVYHKKEWKVGKVISVEDLWKGLLIWDSNWKTVRIQQFYMLKYNSTAVLPKGCVLDGRFYNLNSDMPSQ